MDRCNSATPPGHSATRSIAATLTATILLFSVPPRSSDAGTIRQMLLIECPNGSSLKLAEDAADEAAAVNDADYATLTREAARQFYRCAHVTDNPYLHDWARYFYWTYLWGSLATKGDVNLNGSAILDGLSELAAGSSFADVRKAAADTYNACDRAFEAVRAQLGPP
jgi:hypothetical protein